MLMPSYPHYCVRSKALIWNLLADSLCYVNQNVVMEMKFDYAVSLLSIMNLIIFLFVFFSVGFTTSTPDTDDLKGAFGSKKFSVTEQSQSLLSHLRAIQTTEYHLTSFLQIK